MDNFTVNPMDVLNEKGVDVDEMAEGWQQYLQILGPAMELAKGFGIGKGAKVAAAANKNAPKNDEEEGEQ